MDLWPPNCVGSKEARLSYKDRLNYYTETGKKVKGFSSVSQDFLIYTSIRTVGPFEKLKKEL